MQKYKIALRHVRQSPYNGRLKSTKEHQIMKSNNTSCFLSFMGLSLATGPFIVHLLALYLVNELMAELGKTSEEIFRSERLPILNFPDLDPY